MISNFKEIDLLLNEIDKKLKTRTKIFIIGGAALLYQNLKPATKDIDLILTNIQHYDLFVQAATKIGFEKRNPRGIYSKIHASSILEREDFRLDIFIERVCKKIILSQNMIKRAEPILDLKNLEVNHCSNEDIFIFKSITERQGDIEDCISLAKRGLNWKTIYSEIRSQIDMSGEDVWITWIGERFDRMEEKGLNIPIMDKLNKERDDYFNKIERKYTTK